MVNSEFRFVANDIGKAVEGCLVRSGILCRVFSRGKSDYSLDRKISTGKYNVSGKKIQDAIGVRVVLYFKDDSIIAEQIIRKYFFCIDSDSSIVRPKNEEFSVMLHNLVFKVPNELCEQMIRSISGRAIDCTFELQLRSVLSEGWHEVEHDLRYKCKDYWSGHDDLSRMLNGVMATLETSEWSMQAIFEELAHRNYKEKKWVPMLINKLRIRTQPVLSEAMINFLNESADFAKGLYRMDRKEVISFFAYSDPIIPVSLEHVIYYFNLKKDFSKQLKVLTPKLLIKAFDRQIVTT